MHLPVRPVLCVLLCALFLGSVAEAWGQVSSLGRSRTHSLDIPINKSDVIRVDRPFVEVAVGNPEVADVQILGERAIYVFARQFGSTSVTLSGENGTVIAVVEVNVTHDLGRLRRLLDSVMPDQRIAVRAAHDGIVLSGTVSSATVAANAVLLAERFAPDAVENLMTVRGSQQVLLAVRFVEMRRDTLKRIGLNSTGQFGGNSFSLLGTVLNVFVEPASLAELGVNIALGDLTLAAFLDLLEEKGVVRTLAEPNLVALSGDTADFLAGGEFPIPVAREDDQIRVEFKKFGVGLSFTPTVLSDGLMNLSLFMEVSEPDQANSVEIGGLVLPALVVRRASTTVELRNGQSFAIAGLLQESFTDTVEQIPFLGDVPILGALARSTQYQNGQSELVMIVTPYLAEPANPGALTTPQFEAPTQRQLFLEGSVEMSDEQMGHAGQDGGLAGPFGYSKR